MRHANVLLAILLLLPAAGVRADRAPILASIAKGHQRDTLPGTKWGPIRCGPGCVVAATALAGGRQALIKLARRTAADIARKERRLTRRCSPQESREDLCRGIYHLSVCGLMSADSPRGLQQLLQPLRWSGRHKPRPQEAAVSVTSKGKSMSIGVQLPVESFTIATPQFGGVKTQDGLPQRTATASYLTHPLLMNRMPRRSKVQVPRALVETGCVAGGRGQPHKDATAVAGPLVALCQLVGDEKKLNEKVASAYRVERQRARQVVRALENEPVPTSATLQRLQDVLYFSSTTTGDGLTHGGIHHALSLAGLSTPPLKKLLSGRHLGGGIPLRALPGRLGSGEAAICWNEKHFTLMGRLPGSSDRFFLFDPEGFGADRAKPTIKVTQNPADFHAAYADFKGIVKFPLATDPRSLQGR
jgi:hypothetical protein